MNRLFLLLLAALLATALYFGQTSGSSGFGNVAPSGDGTNPEGATPATPEARAAETRPVLAEPTNQTAPVEERAGTKEIPVSAARERDQAGKPVPLMPVRFSFGDRPGAPELALAMDEYVRREEDGSQHLEKLDPPATPETMAGRLAAIGNGNTIMPVAYPVEGPKTTATRRLVTPDIRLQATDAATTNLSAKYQLQRLSSPALTGDERLLRAHDPLTALSITGELREEGKDARVVLAATRFKRALPNDPLVTNQWHIKKIAASTAGTDVNIESAWNYPGTGIRGTGVRIGIVDDGVQTGHPDFVGNIDTTNDKDWVGNDNDPNPETGDDHGTACAGNAAARGNNSIGVTGTAPEATIVGLRLLGASTTDIQEAEAMLHRNDIISIKSNSWGPADDGLTLEAPGPDTLAAFQTATTSGRGGRGTILVFSAGNGGLEGDNSNKDGYANSIYTIAVGAINSQGIYSGYSERGANLAVCAPSDDDATTLAITTTDRTGANGYNTAASASGGDYTTNNEATGFGGTSSSAPTVAGIIALMLQQNPNLGWRDVKEILMRSAVKIDPTDGEWIINASGMRFNHNYGAGLVDASAAVALAAAWTNLGTATSTVSSQTSLSVAIPDNNSTGITRTFNLSSTSLRVEHVTLKLNINHTARGDLDLRLISPSGTESQLAEVHGDAGANYANWTFSTVRNWGEASTGTWTLRISDRSATNIGTLTSAVLTVYGSNGNLPPKITAASLSATGNAFADQALSVASITATDPENSPLTYAYRWESSTDGVTYAANGPTTASLPANAANAAKLWRCLITPSDGSAIGAPFTTAAVNLLARPPASAKPGAAFIYTSGLVLRAATAAAPRPAIINEFSQGPSGGSSEWIEILTLEPTSLAFWDLTESNGQTLVFADSPVWDDLPAGTLIVVYNGGATKAPVLPADDFDPADGKMVISSTNATYFDNTYNTWISLGNTGGDAINLNDSSGVQVDSISYGTNTTGTPQLAIVGSAKSAQFNGNTSAAADLLANWTVVNENTATPGQPNGGANTTWVNSLRLPPIAPFRIGAGSNVPSALSLNTTTGVLSGTIGSGVTLGNYLIIIERTNDLGEIVSQSFTLEITNANTYAQWIAGYPGLASTNETADPEKDGLPNLVEFLLHNQHPGVSDSGSAVTLSSSGGQLRLTWRESKNTVGAVLEPQWSPDLKATTWQTTGITLQTLEDLSTNRLRQASLPIDPVFPKRFLRLRARTTP
ncbi:MAG: S8 family serine peptidase [Verrucomicrobiales bacterium]